MPRRAALVGGGVVTVRHLGDIIIWMGAVVGGLTAIGGFLYWVAVRPFRRWLREQIGQVREATEQTRDAAEAVHAEVTPNHGSSMKDQLTRTEQKVDQLDRRFTDHLINHPGG